MSKTTTIVPMTKTSQLTGISHTIDIKMSVNQYFRYTNTKDHVQDIFPELDKGIREFLITGTTPQEWSDMFGDS